MMHTLVYPRLYKACICTHIIPTVLLIFELQVCHCREEEVEKETRNGRTEPLECEADVQKNAGNQVDFSSKSIILFGFLYLVTFSVNYQNGFGLIWKFMQVDGIGAILD